VLYWPHTHDGFRLTMSVLTAARHGVTREEGLSTLDLISHTKQLGLMLSVLDQHAVEEERHAKSAGGSLSRAEGAVGAAIDALYRRLADDRTSSIVDIKDSEALSRAFDQLKSTPVSEVFQEAAKSMVPAAPWTVQLKQKLAPHLSDMRAFGDKVRKIRPVILFVEDNQFARNLVQKALEGKDYEIAFAHDGTATLSLLRNMRPDLIMMDVNLPDIDGVSLTRKLKAVPHLAEIPVVMLTSEAKVQTLQSSMDAGATGFVVKPFTREALLAKIDKFLSLAN
jgi:CheY-like chemotaxis protein